ncbi:MAG: hypothetical protein CL759_12130 [Chloroflexi bacterium]|nr:hypothetical protein [Chloroflexota bacterium]
MMIKTNILIVADEEGILDPLYDHLSEQGSSVISAKDGASAIAQVYRERPDIVLLSLNIPEMNDYQDLQELQNEQTTKNLPVVCLTGIEPERGEQAAVDLGVNHYVSKPCKLDTLLAVIRVALKEAGGSGWSRPPASQFRNVNQFTVEQSIPTGGWRPR